MKSTKMGSAGEQSNCSGCNMFVIKKMYFFLQLYKFIVCPFSLSEDVPPYFKTEPGPPQVHLEGNRLVLTCLAEGSWPLEFKWFRNDTAITAFSREYR